MHAEGQRRPQKSTRKLAKLSLISGKRAGHNRLTYHVHNDSQRNNTTNFHSGQQQVSQLTTITCDITRHESQWQTICASHSHGPEMLQAWLMHESTTAAKFCNLIQDTGYGRGAAQHQLALRIPSKVRRTHAHHKQRNSVTAGYLSVYMQSTRMRVNTNTSHAQGQIISCKT